MEIIHCRNYDQLSVEGANLFAALLKDNPGALVSMATGHSQSGLIHELVEMYRQGRIDFGNTWFVGLDEWEGIGKDHPGSGYYFLNEKLCRHVNVKPDHIVFFDGTHPDLAKECRRIDEFILKKGPVDLMVLGVGMNGHIGLNEPGTDIHSFSHVSILDEVTRREGQKYFSKPIELKGGLTLGIQHIMEAGKVIVTLNGVHKAEIARRMIKGPVTPDVPASLLRQHRDLVVMIDREASSLLE